MTEEQVIKNLKSIIEHAEAHDYILGKETRKRMKQVWESILKNSEEARCNEVEGE